jgi:hypothetical protein
MMAIEYLNNVWLAAVNLSGAAVQACLNIYLSIPFRLGSVLDRKI